MQVIERRSLHFQAEDGRGEEPDGARHARADPAAHAAEETAGSG